MEKQVYNIFEWSASLYDDKRRRWKYGTLAILADGIGFTQSNCNSNEKSNFVPFEDMIEVKRSTTGLIFGAIFLVTKNKEKVWLSSLPDREAVYSAIKHFWQAQLFQRNDKERGSSKGQKTKMGQKLLGIVKDSEETLSKAAVQLYDQGRQIDSALDTMSDLHNDLDVADNLVENIESWVGRWRLPDQYQGIDPVVINLSDIPEVFEFEVLFTKLESARVNTRNVGTLRISKDGLTILNLKMKTEFHFRWADVSQLHVVTPWEVIAIKYQIGKPDLKYSLVSANMVAVLRLLDKCAKHKLKYDTPPEPVLCTRHTGREQSQSFKKEVKMTDSNKPVQPNTLVGVNQIQIHQSQQIVSESEADDISRALSGLKSLALAVQEEESEQIEKIDSLTTTVDRANQRLKDTEKRIKRMT